MRYNLTQNGTLNTTLRKIYLLKTVLLKSEKSINTVSYVIPVSTVLVK
jgi:hypothetical protein